jgi:hypothetical protein
VIQKVLAGNKVLSILFIPSPRELRLLLIAMLTLSMKLCKKMELSKGEYESHSASSTSLLGKEMKCRQVCNMIDKNEQVTGDQR